MRRKPSQNGGYNNQNRGKPRYQGSGGGDHRQGGHHQHSSHGGRPRRNYAAAREKYLAQARDALASGDRVLAENYFQHADHCYRMMVEEGYSVRNNAPVTQGDETQAQGAPAEGNNGNEGGGNADGFVPENTNVLPAFLTANPEEQSGPKPVDPATIQNWEERDA